MASIAFHKHKNTFNTCVGAIPNASKSSWTPTTYSQITHTSTKFSPRLVYVYQPSHMSDWFYFTLNLTTATNQKAPYSTSPNDELQRTEYSTMTAYKTTSFKPHLQRSHHFIITLAVIRLYIHSL